MDSSELARTLALALADKQADEILLIDVDELSGYTDVLLIASGRNERHVQALAEHVRRHARGLGLHPIGMEGAEQGRWALLDFGQLVVHIFREQERLFYDLEGMWEDAPRQRIEPPPSQAAVNATP